MMIEPVVWRVAVTHVALVQDHVMQVRLVARLNDRLKLEEQAMISLQEMAGF